MGLRYKLFGQTNGCKIFMFMALSYVCSRDCEEITKTFLFQRNV